MNHTKKLIAALCLVFALHGCDNTEGEEEGLGFIPRIKQVAMYNVNDPDTPTMPESYNKGDKADFLVQIIDPDLDSIILTGTKYQGDSDVPYEGPDEVSLPEQTVERMTYKMIFPMTITEDPGSYRMEFQVEDKKGNKSEVSPITYVVE